MQASVRRSGYNTELLAWTGGDLPGGCPSHRDVRFAFKPYVFDTAHHQRLDVRGHRHDQTVAGLLAHELGMELTTGGLEVWHPDAPIKDDTGVVIARPAVVDLESVPRLDG